MKTLIRNGLCFLSITGLLGLLAGFMPGPLASRMEVRGRLNHNSLIPLSDNSKDTTLLTVGFRGTLNKGNKSEDIQATGNTIPQDTLALRGAENNLLAALGPRNTRPSPAFEKMLHAMPPGVLLQEGNEDMMAAVYELAALAGDGEVLGISGAPLRWENNAAAPWREPGQGPTCLTLPVYSGILTREIPRSLMARAGNYHELVMAYARKYSLDPALVLAIVQIESGFDPSLISARDAHGLMQVVPGAAGDEVHNYLGRSGQPSTTDLLNPENNIRYGTAYLHLLNTRHLHGVINPLSREYCVIAAYNGGPGALLRHFSQDRDEAFNIINSLSPAQVLDRLMNQFPARETRLFVEKVLDARETYVSMR